jgi:hypothetical protein
MPVPAASTARLLAYVVVAGGLACGRPRPTAPVPETRPTERPGVSADEFTPTDTAAFTRVRFAHGTTSGILDDSLAPDRDRGYLLGALQGQVMLAHAIVWTAPGGAEPPEVRVRVYRAHDGAELGSPGGSGPLWFGHLPGTGDYVIRVSAPHDRGIGYTLAVQIPRRLVLDRGHPTTEVSARAPSRAPVDFLVTGEQGKILQAELRGSPERGEAPTLHIYGLDDGVQLAPLPERRRRWSGALPSTQDYIVSVVPARADDQYDLVVGLR